MKSLIAIPSFFQETKPSLDQQINESFHGATSWFTDAILYEIPFTSSIAIPWVLIVLVGGALYFSFYFKGINFKGFFTAINVVRGKYDHLEKSENEKIVTQGNGEVSHFQALTAALSATVGLGNIAGVAIALSIGGAGATFWMIVVGLLGMASKFVECTLGVKYREIASDGTVFGGPMYYLKKGLGELGFGKIGKVLSVLFAIMCVGGSFGGGNMFQVNQAFKLFEYVTGGEQSFIYGKGWLFGLIMAIFAGIVIIGGIKRIAQVAERVVPTMALIYVIGALAVIFGNLENIGPSFTSIFADAFSGSAAIGGFMGASFAYAMDRGINRGLFSNEAGQGSAPIAHASAKGDEPTSEGLVSLLEPFIDTIVICSMTALVIVTTGVYDPSGEFANLVASKQGAALTAAAYGTVISWFPIILSFSIVLFASCD